MATRANRSESRNIGRRRIIMQVDIGDVVNWIKDVIELEYEGTETQNSWNSWDQQEKIEFAAWFSDQFDAHNFCLIIADFMNGEDQAKELETEIEAFRIRTELAEEESEEESDEESEDESDTE
jgi:hypothetical protein